MEFRPNQRFTVRNSRGEEATLAVISQQEFQGQPWVNVRLDGSTEIQSLSAVDLARLLAEQGAALQDAAPPGGGDGLTPEQAILEYERRRGQRQAPPSDAATTEEPAAADVLAARERRAAAEARVMGEEPRATMPTPAPAEPRALGAIGDWGLWSSVPRAIEEWHAAQHEAITRRLAADEKRAIAMLDACEGRVPKMKLTNEQARKAYVDETCLAEEGRALRAEAAARALHLWAERLAGAQR